MVGLYMGCNFDRSQYKNMTNKQRVLNTLKEQIDMYQNAYSSLVNLPEAIFDVLGVAHFTNMNTHNETLHTPLKPDFAAGTSNADMVRAIIRNAGEKGISKSEILDQFPQEDKSKQEHYNAVTNTVALLKMQDEIEGIKPATGKIKGYLWRMKQ